MNDYGGMFANAAGSAAGGIFMNWANQAINYRYGRKMADYNFGLNEKAADAADARRRALYADFESPLAKIRQLKEAGLSPSLYAGAELGGGIGSTSGAQGAGGSGAGMPSSAASPIDLSAIALNNALAKKADAEADRLNGTNFAAQLDAVKVFSEAGLNKAATRVQEAEATLKNITIKYADETQKVSLQKLKYDAEESRNNAAKAFWDAENANLSWQWNLDTFETRKQELVNTCEEIAARAAMEHSKAELNAEERKYVKQLADAALENAKAHTQSAQEYGNYVENMKNYLQEQIKIQKGELTVSKWKVAVDAITDVLQTGAYLIGNGAFGASTKAIKGLVP